jgi:hypothetical protein
MRKIIIACVLLVLSPINLRASQNPIDDAKSLAQQLNPISLALGPLIDQAAAQADGVLQRRLEQLNGVIQLALYSLNQIATQKIDSVDAATRQQIIDVNGYVSTNLLRFNYIVGKNLSDANAYISQNLDKFNFGIANNIASVQLLNTVPLLSIGPQGLTTFKQQGQYTDVFITGSGFRKFTDTPEAYISGGSIRDTHSWFSSEKGVKLDVPSASMGLLQIRIPNELIPTTMTATQFTLNLKIRSGSSFFVPTYSEQSLPLNVCGGLPRYQMIVTINGSGKKWEYSQIPWPGAAPYAGSNVIGVNCKSGNNNSHNDICLPSAPPNGYEIDNSPPAYGIVWGSETGHNRHNVSRLNSACIRLYCEGDDGDAWENIMGVSLKLRRLVDVNQCADPQILSAPLKYDGLVQLDLSDSLEKAQGICKDASGQYTPRVKIAMALHDSAGKDVQVLDLSENSTSEALDGAATFTVSNTGRLDATLKPVCSFHSSPVTR